jgi:hypothetical protein
MQNYQYECNVMKTITENIFYCSNEALFHRYLNCPICDVGQTKAKEPTY